MHKPEKPTERELEIAKMIVALEETEGWAHFKNAVNDLIQTMTPDVSQFTQEQATVYASKLTFVSGIKRCIGLMDKFKNQLK